MLPSIVGSSTLPQPTGRRNPQGGRNPAYKASSPLGCGEVSGGGGGRAGSTRCWQEAAEGCSRVCSSWPSHGAPAPSTHQLWLCRGRVVAEGAQCAGFCPLLGFLFGVEDHRALLSAPPHLLRNTFPPPPLSGTISTPRPPCCSSPLPLSTAWHSSTSPSIPTSEASATPSTYNSNEPSLGLNSARTPRCVGYPAAGCPIPVSAHPSAGLGPSGRLLPPRARISQGRELWSPGGASQPYSPFLCPQDRSAEDALHPADAAGDGREGVRRVPRAAAEALRGGRPPKRNGSHPPHQLPGCEPLPTHGGLLLPILPTSRVLSAAGGPTPSRSAGSMLLADAVLR